MQLKELAQTVVVAGCLTSAGVSSSHNEVSAQEAQDSVEGHYFTWDQTGGEGLQTFNESEDLTIIEPAIVLTQTIGQRWSLNAKYGIDIISAASLNNPEIHTASGASGNDRRYQQDLSVTYIPTEDLLGDRTFLNLGLSQSREYGYKSGGFTVGLSQEFLDRNFVWDLSFNRLTDTIQTYPITDDGISDTQQKTTDNWSTSATQLLTRKSLIHFALQWTRQQGYLARSLNSVRVRNGPRQQERLPDSRNRLAIKTQYNAFVGSRSAYHLIYRYYQDDFDVSAHTFQGRLFHGLPFQFEIGGQLRYHTQTAVKYWERDFEGDETYVTSDSDLAALNSTYGGLQLSWRAVFSESDFVISSFMGQYRRSDGLTGNGFGLSIKYLF